MLFFLKLIGSPRFPLDFRCAKKGLAFLLKDSVVITPHFCNNAISNSISSLICSKAGKFWLKAAMLSLGVSLTLSSLFTTMSNRWLTNMPLKCTEGPLWTFLSVDHVWKFVAVETKFDRKWFREKLFARGWVFLLPPKQITPSVYVFVWLCGRLGCLDFGVCRTKSSRHFYLWRVVAWVCSDEKV